MHDWMYERMDELMDGIDGCGWRDVLTDGWMDGRKEELNDGLICALMDGCMYV